MAQSFFAKDGTAQGVAKQRYIETLAKPEHRVINDPYSKSFVIGSGVIKLMGHKLNSWLSQKLAPGFHEHLISRTRFIDELVEKCSRDGKQQYVILGAGYDSRAHRLDLSSSLKIFEVDQKEVQDRKLSKLPSEVPNSENITYVSVDFSNQSLSEQLLDAGFDQSKSTVFTLEGVAQYVSKEALITTIKEVEILSKDSESIFFLSYVNELLSKNPEACFGRGYRNPEKKAALIQNLSEKAGEPWIYLYSNEEIEDLLAMHGFSIEENITFSELNSRFFAPLGRDLPEDQIFKLEQLLVAKS